MGGTAWRIALFCVSLSVAAGASAQDIEESVDARIAATRQLVLYARYAQAESAADELLVRLDLTAAQRNEVLEMRAIILLARRQARRADEVLRELYGRDPGHQLLDRDVGPEVRAAFERVRDARPPLATVTLENASEPRMPQRQSPPLAVRITEGADVVHELRVSFRNGDSGRFERIVMLVDEARTQARTRIPLAEGTGAYVLQYYVEALAPSQAVVGGVGSADEPLSVEVPEEVALPSVPILTSGGEIALAPSGPSVFEEWWFWTIVGVLVAGGAATLGALYGTGTVGQSQTGTLGDGRLELRWP